MKGYPDRFNTYSNTCHELRFTAYLLFQLNRDTLGHTAHRTHDMSIPVKYQPSALPFTELVQTLKQIKAERKPRASSSTSSKPNLSSSDASRVEVGTVTAKREALLAALTVPLRVDQRGFTLQEAAVWLGATKYYDPLWRYAEVKATGDCRAKGSMDVVCRQHLAGLRSVRSL